MKQDDLAPANRGTASKKVAEDDWDTLDDRWALKKSLMLCGVKTRSNDNEISDIVTLQCP